MSRRTDTPGETTANRRPRAPAAYRRTFRRARRGVSNSVIVVIVVVVAVVALLGGLFAAGVLRFGSSSSSPPGGSSAAPAYAVDFDESGLPSGTDWSVTLGTASSGTGSTIAFDEKNGTYSYTIGTVAGYTAVPASGQVVVAGGPKTVAIAFSGSATSSAHYSVTLTEQGLPASTSWSVTLNPGAHTQTSTTTTLVFSEPNGSYTYTVGPVAGYTVSPSNGAVSVTGAAVSVSLTFTATVVTTTYPVAFLESGLPSGASWSVTLNGTVQTGTVPAGSTLTFSEANGSYSYTVPTVSYGGTTYTPTPASGSTPVKGASVSVSVAFSSSSIAPGGSLYPVTFDATGLPGNVTWEVALVVGNYSNSYLTPTTPVGGQLGDGATQTLEVPNGTYSWVVAPSSSALPNGSFYATTMTTIGHLTVQGAPVTVPVGFVLANASSPTLYTVTFEEGGLPSGYTWAVTLNGTQKSATAGTSIAFAEPNASFYDPIYSVLNQGTNGYASYLTTTFAVGGAPLTVPVTFTNLYTASFPLSGSLWAGANWSLALTDHTNTSYSLTYAVQGVSGGYSVPLPNGSFSYAIQSVGYAASPAFGTFTISGTAPTISAISLTALTNYTVSFQATGVPSTDLWALDVWQNAPGQFLGGSLSQVSYSLGGTGSTVTFSLSDGNYSWYVLFAGGFTGTNSLIANPMAGGFVVAGASVNMSLSFTAASGEYPVVLWQVEGAPLPNGTNWGVTVNGVTYTTSGDVDAFPAANGTVSYVLDAPSGYSAFPAAGSLVVNSTGGFGLFGAGIFLAFYTGALAPVGAGHVPGPAGASVADAPSGPPALGVWSLRAE